MGEYIPTTYEDFERAYRLTPPPPRWTTSVSDPMLIRSFCMEEVVEGFWGQFLLLFWGQGEDPKIDTLLIEEDCLAPGSPAVPLASGGAGGPTAVRTRWERLKSWTKKAIDAMFD